MTQQALPSRGRLPTSITERQKRFHSISGSAEGPAPAARLASCPPRRRPTPRPRAHHRLTQKFNQLLLPSLSGLGAREGGEEGEGRKNQGGFHSFPTLNKKEIKKQRRAKKKKLSIYYSRDNSTQHTLTHTHARTHTHAPHQKGELIRGINAPARLGREGRGRGAGQSVRQSPGPSSHRRRREQQRESGRPGPLCRQLQSGSPYHTGLPRSRRSGAGPPHPG